MNRYNIRYLKYDEIDTDRWDHCMDNSPNSLIYAQSWYLDKLCDIWDALVIGDYQYVMPLTFKKKFGIAYLYQPFFCQQLGVFPTPTKEISLLFYKELVRRFQFSEINLNAMHLPVEEMPKKELRYNFLLSLAKPYPELSENYSNHTRRKLKKAGNNKLNYVTGLSIKEYLQFKKDNMVVKMSKETFMKLHNILAFAISRNLGKIYGVYSADNTLCSAAFFIRHKKRVTYLNAATSKEGKVLNAMYFLIDRFVQEHAGKDYYVDFEGSAVPGVARMYEGFGASPEIYYHVSWNNLPTYVKWLKK